jgi:hypothetical protein
MAVVAMPPVHEEVHERAEQDHQEGQGPEEVRAVLGQEEEAEHGGEHQPDPGKDASRPPVVGALDGRHRQFPSQDRGNRTQPEVYGSAAVPTAATSRGDGDPGWSGGRAGQKAGEQQRQGRDKRSADVRHYRAGSRG